MGQSKHLSVENRLVLNVLLSLSVDERAWNRWVNILPADDASDVRNALAHFFALEVAIYEYFNAKTPGVVTDLP